MIEMFWMTCISIQHIDYYGIKELLYMLIFIYSMMGLRPVGHLFI